MSPRVIKVSKKTKEMFKDARGINDPRRDGKIRTYYVSHDYFCSTFLPEWEHCETKKQIDWVYEKMINEMFDDYYEDGFDLELYYVDNGSYNLACLCWRLPQYSKDWQEVHFNTSSIFALQLCDLDDDCSSESEED
jgi:hypothetical protein